MLIDNNNFNSEIFKRSIPVFSFAFAQRMLTRKHLSQILTYLIELPSLHKDKHELDLKLFYGCIADFGTFLDKATTVDFFKQITTLPIEENMIVLVK